RRDGARNISSPPAGADGDFNSARSVGGIRGTQPGTFPPAGGLLMSRVFSHEPVMVREVVDLFAPVPDGAVLPPPAPPPRPAAHPQLSVMGLDRHPGAVAAPTDRLAPHGSRAAVRHARFDTIAAAVDGPVSGVLFDLGVSSPQLDRGERGFAFRNEGPLDMR